MTGETVTVLRPGASTRDAHGNDAPGADTEIPVEGCTVWPTGSDEQTQGQDQNSDHMSILFPYGTDVRSTDRLRIRGLVYQVDGVAQAWASPFTGTRAGTQVAADRVTG